jgi:hypothetical protein
MLPALWRKLRGHPECHQSRSEGILRGGYAKLHLKHGELFTPYSNKPLQSIPAAMGYRTSAHQGEIQCHSDEQRTARPYRG